MTASYDFNDLKLLPGVKVDLRSDQFAQFKGTSLYVGFRPGKGLIVTTPVQGGKPLSCKAGTSVILRFFANHLRSACAFRSQVTSVATSPYHHLHLSEPTSIEIGEVRNSIRASVSLDASVFSDFGGGTSCGVVINDLSVDGAKIHSEKALGREGNQLKLTTRITVLEQEDVVVIKAIIRSVAKPAHNEYVYGVQFTDLGQLDKLMIYSFVTTSLIV